MLLNNFPQERITAKEYDKVSGKYSLVAGLFNPNSPVPKTSCHLSSHSPSQGVKTAHSTSSKRKLDDEKDLNVGNEISD